MVKYTVLADVRASEFQNVQELATIGGEIEREISDLGGELIDSFAILGSYDFQFTFEADGEEQAMQIVFAIERLGLDARTHQVVDTDRLGELTDEI